MPANYNCTKCRRYLSALAALSLLVWPPAQASNKLSGKGHGPACKTGINANSQVQAALRQAPLQDKWAVLIGIDKFRNQTIPPLRFAKKDALDFARFLVEKGNFAQDHVLILTNELATKFNIEDALGDDWLPRRAGPDDLIVFFASTHGSPKEIDVAGENFLIAYDTDPQKLFTTALKFSDLAPTIKQRTGCQRIVLLLDACDSGAANVSKGLVRQSNFDVSNIVGEGQIVISSSSADQRSYESKRYDNGVFTKHLMAALEKKGAETTLDEAFDYLKTQVESEVRYDRTATQTPVMRSKWSGGELILLAVPSKPRTVPSESSFSTSGSSPLSEKPPPQTENQHQAQAQGQAQGQAQAQVDNLIQQKNSYEGEWTGQWSNTVGESGFDSLVLKRDAAGVLRGMWSGNVPVTGRELDNGLEIHGRTSRREYVATGGLKDGVLSLQYTAQRLDGNGFYQGRSTFRRVK